MADIAIVKLSTQKYGWSKYGGARHGLVQENQDEWFCQSCGGKQTKELPAYLIGIDDTKREFMKACSVCFNTAILRDISCFMSLSGLIRKDLDKWW